MPKQNGLFFTKQEAEKRSKKFTGADKRRLGKFELANNGTLFLDEIGGNGCRSPGEGTADYSATGIERVGGEKTIFVDVRPVCATNVDIKQAVADNASGGSLLSLNVVEINTPQQTQQIDIFTP